MPWDLTYHAGEPDEPKVGDIWAAPDWEKSNIISDRYKAEWAGKRPPLMVCLPSKHDPHGDRFLLDRCAGGAKDRKGWKITIKGELVPGEKPNITVHPSINCIGSYHGHIKNGRITDDCEGRTYKIA